MTDGPDHEMVGWILLKALEKFGVERVSLSLEALVHYFGRPRDE